jgi:hypothetical protein
MEDCVLNGELTIDGYKRTIANGMVNSIMDIVEKLKKEVKLKRVRKIAAFEDKHGPMADALDKMRITVWDMISVDEYFEGKSVTEYHIRYNSLRKMVENKACVQVQVDLIETRFITTYEEAMDHFLDTQKEVLKVQLSKLLMLVGRMGNQHIKSK